jgi:hypothetical protein
LPAEWRLPPFSLILLLSAWYAALHSESPGNDDLRSASSYLTPAALALNIHMKNCHHSHFKKKYRELPQFSFKVENSQLKK